MNVSLMAQSGAKSAPLSGTPATGQESEGVESTFLHLLAKLYQDRPLNGQKQLMAGDEELLPDDKSLDELSGTQLTEEQWDSLLTALVQLLEALPEETTSPSAEHLIEQINRLIDGQKARTDFDARERLLSDVLKWLGQQPEQAQWQVTKQIVQLLVSVDSIHPLTVDGNRHPRKGISGKDAKVMPLIPVATSTDVALLKEDVKATVHQQSVQAGVTLAQSHSTMPHAGIADTKNRGSVFPRQLPQGVHTGPSPAAFVDNVAGNGELVETAGGGALLREEAVFHTTASPVASDKTSNSPLARLVMWQSGTFSEMLQQHVLRHLQINHNGVSQARLSLYPENLGQVDVRISSHNGVLTAHLVADTWIAKELLDGQLDQLRQALQNQGLQVNKLEVSIGQQGLLSRHPHRQDARERGTSPLRREQSISPVNPTDLYTDGETSRVESWRNPHASVNYTV